MTKDELKALRAIAEKSTRVVAWHPHAGGDCYGPDASVRGPFMRWLKVTQVEPYYVDSVASATDDAKFAAAAMNNLVPLVEEVERLRRALEFLIAQCPHDGEEAVCMYCDMGGAGYSSKGENHHDDTRDVCPVVVAQRALSHEESAK